MKQIRIKCLQKIFYDFNNRSQNLLVIFLILIIIMATVLYFLEKEFFYDSTTSPSPKSNKQIKESQYPLPDDSATQWKHKNVYERDPIDLVYTWVNGTDPAFIKSAQLYNPMYDPSRFHDKNELKYSLRSIVKYAPWIRHIYIVTNGQIPYWLNLDNPRVTIISHFDLYCAEEQTECSILPIFSSPSIETYLHLIPNLSKQFLYLNDDLFLGVPIYPDDLFTQSSGVNIFTAWNVPDCALDCPWVYVGDGSCDSTCNIEQCQFDGGDCIAENIDLNNKKPKKNVVSSSVPKKKYLINENSLPIDDSFVDIPRSKPLIRSTKSSFLSNMVQNSRRSINESNIVDIKQSVEHFNRNKQKSIKYQRKKYRQTLNNKDRLSQPSPPPAPPILSPSQKLFSEEYNTKNPYERSLIETNKIFNRIYGYKQRKVIAHVGLYLDRSIISEMIAAYPKEFQQTRQHRFRHPNDMQFSFAYYYHLMEQTINKTISDIFDDYDTDHSGTWSDREIRTLLSRIYTLPLDWGGVHYFEEVITNCSKNLQASTGGGVGGVDANETENISDFIKPTLLYERYENSNIPRVTKRLVKNCPELNIVLLEHFAKIPKYKFTINLKTTMHSNFKMLTSNVTHVVNALDELRRTPRKFNCINDNLDYQLPEENELIIALLEDFYLSLFPEKSEFELPDNYRNRFHNIFEYREWSKHNQKFVWIICLLLLLILWIFIRFNWCIVKKNRTNKFVI